VLNYPAIEINAPAANGIINAINISEFEPMSRPITPPRNNLFKFHRLSMAMLLRTYTKP